MSSTDIRRAPTFSALTRDPVLAAAFGFGAGLSPLAPGTVGTLAAVPLWWLLSGLDPWGYLGVTAMLFLSGVWVCGRGCAKTHGHDHPGIVFDEMVGFLIAMSLLPDHWGWLLAGFALFRFLDIVKPWPINLADRRVTGGFGVMLDDALAGLFTTVILGGLGHFTGLV